MGQILQLEIMFPYMPFCCQDEMTPDYPSFHSVSFPPSFLCFCYKPLYTRRLVPLCISVHHCSVAPCLHAFVSPCLCASVPPGLHASISPGFQASVPPCLHVSMSLWFHASVPPCLCASMSSWLHSSMAPWPLCSPHLKTLSLTTNPNTVLPFSLSACSCPMCTGCFGCCVETWEQETWIIH